MDTPSTFQCSISLHSDVSSPPSDRPCPNLQSVHHESFRSRGGGDGGGIPAGDVRAYGGRGSPANGIGVEQGCGDISTRAGNMEAQGGGLHRAPLASQDDVSNTSAWSSTFDVHTSSTNTSVQRLSSAALDAEDNAYREEEDDDIDDDDNEMARAAARNRLLHWRSTPCLSATARRDTELEHMSLQHPAPPHHDSGVSGISGYSRDRVSGVRDHESRRRMNASTSDVSRLSCSSGTPTSDVIIMHTEADTEAARKLRKTVKKACKKGKLQVRVDTWDDRTTAGISAKLERDQILNQQAILFFLVTENFLANYRARRRDCNGSTVTDVMYELLDAARPSSGHLLVPVKQSAGKPAEENVADVFPQTKCLKLDDRQLGTDICKSVKSGGVAKKEAWWKRSRQSITSTLTLSPAPFQPL